MSFYGMRLAAFRSGLAEASVHEVVGGFLPGGSKATATEYHRTHAELASALTELGGRRGLPSLQALPDTESLASHLERVEQCGERIQPAAALALEVAFGLSRTRQELWHRESERLRLAQRLFPGLGDEAAAQRQAALLGEEWRAIPCFHLDSKGLALAARPLFSGGFAERDGVYFVPARHAPMASMVIAACPELELGLQGTVLFAAPIREMDKLREGTLMLAVSHSGYHLGCLRRVEDAGWALCSAPGVNDPRIMFLRPGESRLVAEVLLVAKPKYVPMDRARSTPKGACPRQVPGGGQKLTASDLGPLAMARGANMVPPGGLPINTAGGIHPRSVGRVPCQVREILPALLVGIAGSGRPLRRSSAISAAAAFLGSSHPASAATYDQARAKGVSAGLIDPRHWGVWTLTPLGLSWARILQRRSWTAAELVRLNQAILTGAAFTAPSADEEDGAGNRGVAGDR